MCLDAAEVPHALYQRVGLLRGRFLVEAEDPMAIYGAMEGHGLCAKLYSAPSSVVGALRSKTAAQLDREDALSYACATALRGSLTDSISWSRACAAVDLTAKEWIGMFFAEDPFGSPQQCPTDDKPIKMVSLLLELLRSDEVPDLLNPGLLFAVNITLQRRPAVVGKAMELNLIEVIMAQLSRAGTPSECLSVARRSSSQIAGRGYLFAGCSAVMQISLNRDSSTGRSNLDVLVSSGLFDYLVSALREFERGGVQGLQTVDIGAVFGVITILRSAATYPDCATQIRDAASALAFAMAHSLDFCEEFGMTTGSHAAALCEILHRCCPHPRASLVVSVQSHTDCRCNVQVVLFLAATKEALQSHLVSSKWTRCAMLSSVCLCACLCACMPCVRLCACARVRACLCVCVSVRVSLICEGLQRLGA